MNNAISVELKRDCPAVQIPSGESGTLPQGMTVFITQALGHSITVRTDHGLFRISESDADALGLEPKAPPAAAAAGGTGGSGGGGPVTEAQVWEVLRQCYDPEIPVNIVDLGLVYDLAITPTSGGQARVDVKMTLTAPGCGMGPSIAGDAQQRILMLDGVEDASVEIVWDPAWHQSMITAEGRRLLGLE